MKHKTLLTRIGAMAMASVMAFSMFAFGASATSEADATIDTSRSTSLTLYKYDMTSAEEDGAWTRESYVSTGLADSTVNTALSPYAIQGVEFTYLKVADIGILKENESSTHHVMPLYGLPDNATTASLLTALGLTSSAAYKTGTDILYFQSDTLINALATALHSNATTTKAALEQLVSTGGTAMTETDANGQSAATNLAQGLYLLVETRVPEDVVDTTAPFLVSLPMTTIDGNEWNYDITLYPKNETGNPNLEKTLRESKNDTGKNQGKTDDITDGYAHTATASDGDVVDYQIISTLPTITSPATALTTYTFEDVLSKGIQYNKNDVKIEFFEDAACTDLVATWAGDSGKFNVAYTDYSASTGSKMTITMAASGLTEINTATTVYNPATSLLRGYSNLTMRITYACTVNSDATTVYGDSGNPNEVTLTWKRTNTAYSDTLKDDCHLYTYGIDLTKEFSDGAGNFANVKFLLKNSTDNYYVQASLDSASGVYYVTGHTANEADATRFVPVSGSGKVLVKGLEDDSYVLTEVETDSGYKLLKEDISVAITAGEGTTTHTEGCGAALLTATAMVNNAAVTMTEDNSSVHALVPLTVTNTKGFDLPKTGGSGSMAIYLLGAFALLMAASIGVAVLRKKKHA